MNNLHGNHFVLYVVIFETAPSPETSGIETIGAYHTKHEAYHKACSFMKEIIGEIKHDRHPIDDDGYQAIETFWNGYELPSYEKLYQDMLVLSKIECQYNEGNTCIVDCQIEEIPVI